MINNYLSYDALCAKATETVYLFERLWRKNTTALLFTPTPEASTAFALEVAQSVCDSSPENLLFIDVFENLTDHIRRLPRFSNFLAVSPQADDGNEEEDYAETLLKTIERAAIDDGINIFIINSLSRAAALSFGRSSSAGNLMKRIVALQRRLGISILVVASKSTRPVDNTLRLLATESFTTDDIEALRPEVLYPQPQEPEQPCTEEAEQPCPKEPVVNERKIQNSTVPSSNTRQHQQHIKHKSARLQQLQRIASKPKPYTKHKILRFLKRP